MGRHVLFVTGNERKIWQAKACLEPMGITVDAKNVELDEIQSNDPIKISIAKAKAAYAQTKVPLVICDHSWSFRALKGFPGGYMKDMNQWLDAEDWLNLMHGKQDRTVMLTEVVVYVNGNTIETFDAVFPGRVLEEIRGNGNVSMERVVAFDGSDMTIAEHIDVGEHAREMERSAWNKFGKWYANTP